MRTALVLIGMAWTLCAQEMRLPQLKLEDTTAGEQRALAERMLKQTRSGLTGPFNPMLRSPEMSQDLMDLYLYFRYKTPLPRASVELAILITGREWHCAFEWYMHYPIAKTEGVPVELMAAIREGKRPTSMKPNEEAVHDFTVELLQKRTVSDANYAKVLKAFGEKGVVDLTALISTYSTYAALLNVNRQPIPAGSGPEHLPAR